MRVQDGADVSRSEKPVGKGGPRGLGGQTGGSVTAGLLFRLFQPPWGLFQWRLEVVCCCRLISCVYN